MFTTPTRNVTVFRPTTLMDCLETFREGEMVVICAPRPPPNCPSRTPRVSTYLHDAKWNMIDTRNMNHRARNEHHVAALLVRGALTRDIEQTAHAILVLKEGAVEVQKNRNGPHGVFTLADFWHMNQGRA